MCSTASRAYTAPTCRDTTPHHAAPVARRPRASARLALVDVGLLIFRELQLPRWHGTDARDLHVRMSYLVRCWLTCRVHIATDESSVAAHMEANIMACSIGESSRSYDVGLLTTGLLTGTCPTRYVAAIMSTSIAPACVSIDCRQPITGLCSARPRQVRDDGWPSRQTDFMHHQGCPVLLSCLGGPGCLKNDQGTTLQCQCGPWPFLSNELTAVLALHQPVK